MTRPIVFLLLAALAAPAATITLYNGSLNTGPGSQGWLLAGLGTGSYTESLAGGAATLTATGLIRAGYGRTSPIALNRALGYELIFDLQLISETHSSADRAGLSVLVIGNDLRGLELAFWAGEVWAQNAGFTHGEGAAFNTGQRTAYTLSVQGGTYHLYAGSTALLTGSLRDYSASGLPYSMPNSLFVGDNTFSANAVTSFYGASLSDVPEPATGACAAAALLALVCLIRRGTAANTRPKPR